MMLNIMALVFGRMPEVAPFFVKPLLKIVANKVEQGPAPYVLACSSQRFTVRNLNYTASSLRTNSLKAPGLLAKNYPERVTPSPASLTQT
jgi:hypothetical protein